MAGLFSENSPTSIHAPRSPRISFFVPSCLRVRYDGLSRGKTRCRPVLRHFLLVHKLHLGTHFPAKLHFAIVPYIQAPISEFRLAPLARNRQCNCLNNCIPKYNLGTREEHEFHAKEAKSAKAVSSLRPLRSLREIIPRISKPLGTRRTSLFCVFCAFLRPILFSDCG